MYAEESVMIGELREEALDRVKAARIALLKDMPFYGTLLSGIPLVANWSWLETAATDHRNLFFNPEFICGMPLERKKRVFARIDKHPKMDAQQKADYKAHVEAFFGPKTLKEIIFILLHEIRHITNEHMARGKAYDSKQFNVAADQYINTNLVMELGRNNREMNFFPDGKQTVFKPGKEFGWMASCYCDFRFHGLTSEVIYELLNKGWVPKSGVGMHIGEYDPERDILGYTDPQPTMSDIDKDEALSWSADMIEAALKSCGGEGPQEARDLVARMGKPAINYLTIIKQRMISKRKSNVSYRRPARRSGSVTHTLRGTGHLSRRQSIVLPGRAKAQTIDIVVGFDVSGSISQTTLNRIFNEIIGLCILYPEFRVTLFCWSTKVGNTVVYTKDNIKDMLKYQVDSTGGTWASCAFEHIDEHIPKAQEVIIFTDGYIEDLNNQKGKEWGRKYDTLWVICDRKGQAWKCPFGKAVNLDDHVK